jgi:phage repressor protein C with HTH and peptisase S24 domain
MPRVLPFETHLPLYDIEAAAGKFGTSQQDVEPQGWVEVPRDHIALTPDMYVTHIKGRSMEPTIPDGSLCAFKGKVSAPYEGKVVLIEDPDQTGGNRYTVKRYRASKNIDPNTRRDGAWLHERVTLESINPSYPAWDVASDHNIGVIGEFIFVVASSGRSSGETD